LLDRRVLDFCLSLPSEMYLHKGRSRFLFRQVAEKLLPESISRAQKLREDERNRVLFEVIDSALMMQRTENAHPRGSVAAERAALFVELWSAVNRELANDPRP
jgi:hypothetical protein